MRKGVNTTVHSFTAIGSLTSTCGFTSIFSSTCRLSQLATRRTFNTHSINFTLMRFIFRHTSSTSHYKLYIYVYIFSKFIY